MATISNNTSSNGIGKWRTYINYSITNKGTYHTVSADLYLEVQYQWNFTLNKGYSLTINGNKVSGNTQVVSTSDTSDWKTYKLLSHSVNITHTDAKTINISGYIDASNVWYENGGCYIGTYSLSQNVTLAALYSKCTAPTSVSVTPSVFENNVTVAWSGAKGGTNNAIKYYYVQYCTSTDNKTWGSWTTWVSPSFSSTTTTYTKDMSSVVSRGSYIKFRIRTEGTAGSSYYSDFRESSSIRRQPYTKCSAPTTFTISSNNFNKMVDIVWSGASGGTSNSINGYYIEYALSDDNSTWGSWSSLQTYSTTLSYGSLSQKDMSTIVARGKYVKLRIRTQGSAGSSYYSDYKESNVVQRDLKSKCQPPSEFTAKAYGSIDSSQYSQYVFEDFITFEHNQGTAGDNVAISHLRIYYQIATVNSDGSLNWNTNWLKLTEVTNSSGTLKTNIAIHTSIGRGKYIRFGIMTYASDTNYNSDMNISQIMKRNTLPNTVTVQSAENVNTFSNGEPISIKWNTATDNDNISPYTTNVLGYKIYGRYSTDMEATTWSDWRVVDDVTITEYTIVTSTDFYKNINNERYCEIKVVPYDMFCGESQLLELLNNSVAFTIQRYDRSGVAIGIDGKWIDCQVYYGMNDEFIDCDVYVGIDGQWVRCNGIDN